MTAMNPKIRVYLAGSMGGRLGREVLFERDRAVKACQSHCLDPIDPARNEGIDPERPVDLSMSYVDMKNFVAKDEYAIKHCDVLLVLTGDSPSEGTGLEFGLALQLGLPVILVAPKRVQGRLMGFWNIKASALFSTVEDAARFIAANYSHKEEVHVV